MKRLITLTFVLAIMLSAGAFNVGDKAPNFTLKSLDGNNVSLSDYEGKVVLLFFFGNGCPSCIGVGRNRIQPQIIKEYGGNPDFVALGIDVWNGNNASVRNFRDATSLDMTLLLNGRTIASNYQTTYDRLFVVGPDGKFVSVGTSTANGDMTKTLTTISMQLANFATNIEPIEAGSSQQVAVFPNPMNQSAQISFSVDSPGNVSVSVYDLSGQMVQQLFNGSASAGKQNITFYKNELPSGVYFYKVTHGNSNVTGRIIIQ